MTSEPPQPREKNHRDAREVEWQLASTDLSPVRRWLAEHPQIDGLILEPRPTVHILDTYFDTDDWRIHRAGYALRIRTESGKAEATLKSLQSANAKLADRRELSEELDNSETNSIRHSTGPVGQRVQDVSGPHDLVPLFEVRTSREKFAVREPDSSQELGEIALDETVIAQPSGEARTTLQRVEVEALTQSHKPLQSLVKKLRRSCALDMAGESKYAQGLKSAGLAPAPPPNLLPTVVSASMRIDEAACAKLRQYLSAWHAHEPGARLGDDPEELHDLRVAGRKLDAILRQFRAFLPAPLLQVRPTLKQLLRALGEARDLDVALLELDAFTLRLAHSEQSSATPLRQYLLEERALARARMLNLLDSAEVQRDFATLTELLTQPLEQTEGPGSQLALQAAPRLLRDRYRKVRKGADRLGARSSMAAFHKVRGRVKKLRYLLETVDILYGKPAAELLRALRRWQEKLGIQQDADVAGRRLQSLASAPPSGIPAEALFLMGRLAQHHCAAGSEARKDLARAYRKVRDRWKKLRSHLSLPAPAAPATA